MVHRAGSVRTRSCVVRSVRTAVSRLLTIAVLTRGYDHILNIVIDWKIYSRFLHFHLLLGANQRRLRSRLRYRCRPMMIWISCSIDKVSNFRSVMIVMITRSSMPMMDSTVRLTRILKMISTCRLTQISPIGFFRVSSIFPRSNSSSLRPRCSRCTRLIDSYQLINQIIKTVFVLRLSQLPIWIVIKILMEYLLEILMKLLRSIVFRKVLFIVFDEFLKLLL